MGTVRCVQQPAPPHCSCGTHRSTSHAPLKGAVWWSRLRLEPKWGLAAQVVAVGPRDMRMYYHSYDAAAARWTIGMATSEDGFRWVRAGPVFAGGGDGAAFDARGAAARHVVRDVASRR